MNTFKVVFIEKSKILSEDIEETSRFLLFIYLFSSTNKLNKCLLNFVLEYNLVK